MYDCTKYLDSYPGGAESILINAGENSTEGFLSINSSKATKMLEKFCIGDVDTGSTKTAADVPVKEDVDFCLLKSKVILTIIN